MALLAGAAGGAPDGAHPDHPRPRRRRRRRRQDRGHVRRPDRRDAPTSTTCTARRPTRTPRACSSRSRAWTRRARTLARDRRPAAEPDADPAGLRVQPALPVRPGHLPHGAARAARGRPRPRGGLPLLPRRSSMAEAILTATGPGQALPDPGWRAAADGRPRQGRRRRLLRALQGRDAGHRGRVRLWQVHPGPAADAPRGADRRVGRLRRGRHVQAARPRHAQAAPRHPDRVPGPVHLAQPPQDGRRHRRGAVRHPPRRGAARAGPAQGGPGAARPRRPQPGAHQPLPAPVLRWPAPAHRHRPRHRAEPQGADLRRAGLRARRVGAGAGRQPDGEAAGRARPVLHLHRARPVRRAAHLRPRRRDVPRQDGRARRRGPGVLRGPTHPYTQALLSAVPVPDPTLREQARADRPHGRRALAGEPAVGLPVPHPLLEGAGAVLGRRARAESTARTASSAHLSACHFASPREIIETIDVSEVGQPTA